MRVYWTDLFNEVNNTKLRKSAWNKGVKEYALDLVENMPVDEQGRIRIDSGITLKDFMLNGAKNWYEYSYGGFSLIYDSDIAQRLCNKTELKRTHNGEYQPNKFEDWLDVQSRALYQAYLIVYACYNYIVGECEQ